MLTRLSADTFFCCRAPGLLAPDQRRQPQTQTLPALLEPEHRLQAQVGRRRAGHR